MDTRPRQSQKGLPPPGNDLDSTDELPVLDPKAYEASLRDRLADTWVQPTLPAAATAEPAAGADTGEDTLQTAVANLHEAQELLASREARLIEVERALEEARASGAAAGRRAEQLTQELAQARSAAELKDTEHAAGQAEARAAAQRQQTQHAAELDEARALAERREAELGEELSRARAAAGQRSGELADELAAAQRAARQREMEHAFQLDEAKLAGEVRLLAEREAATETQRVRDLESRETLAARDRERAALAAELAQMRVQAAAGYESSQCAEQRRALFEGLLSDLQSKLDAHETGHARLVRELADRDRRTAGLETDLERRAARIADLEKQSGNLSATLAQRDQELARLRTTQTNLNTALEAARTAAAGVSTRAAEHEAVLGEARSRSAALETELAAARRQGAEREQELAKVRADMEDWAGALRTAQAERSGHLASISAGATRAKQLEDQVAGHMEAMRALQSATDAARARIQELEGDLRVAEEAIGRLESQLRGRNTRVAELEKANQQWRHTLEESRVAHHDTDTHNALHGALSLRPEEEGPAREPLPEGAARLLIRSDGGREVMHVLARKTGIGRTPDNDLQIDAKYISRHHAVILAGPANTIIEDLNSTNGVLVNGRRITRQILKDGDQVCIGRSEYRFAVRRTGDKR